MTSTTNAPLSIVVTGGSGAIGTAVLNWLSQQPQVSRLTSLDAMPPSSSPSAPKITFQQADLTDFDTVLNALRGHDAVIHLASKVAPSEIVDVPVDTYNLNTAMSYNVLRAAAQLRIRRVAQASSINAIGGYLSRGGPTFDYFPVDEKHPARPHDAYSLSKLVAETQATAVTASNPGLRVASLRIHMTKSNSREEAVHLRGVPNGLSDVDAWDLWGYGGLDECARAFLSALTSEGWEGHEVFYVVASDIATDHTLTSEQLREKYWANVSLAQKEWWGTDPQNLYKGFFDCSKAKRLLAWEHQ